VELIRGDLLGWQPFRDLLARHAATPPGRDRALTLTPSVQLDTIQATLAETTEARRALTAEGPPPWDGTGDARPLLDEAAPPGAALDGPALVALARTLAAATRLAAYGRRVAAVAPGLGARWQGLPTCPDLAERLGRALDPDGRLTDQASPRLRALRRELTQLRADLQARLERLLDHPAVAPALQDRYVTIRNGRYVLPVRDDARRDVRGIIHDRSQSGATVFVEPEAVIALNNELTRLGLEAEAEEARILLELTDLVRVALPALARLVDGLGALDLVFARAGLAEAEGAVEPVVTADGDLDLPAARHPLLLAQRRAGQPRGPVVPVDLRLPAARPALVISGPNTGGKTVALETIGLLVLMAQAGCHVPAAPGSRLPVRDQVLAVIGDEQSLAQDLSTFSSFVTQVRTILDEAGPRSLVLLDELGAGTDPAEGAALGAALLEALLDRGARVVATTHLEPLKVFAQLEPRIENATVAFDAERLEPTFRLEYGHPGPSYALPIAERLGLPASVIARARAHLGETGRRLESLLAALETRTREAEARAVGAAAREAEALAARAAAERQLARTQAEAGRVRAEAETEARALLEDARREVGHALDRLKPDETRRRREAQDAYRRLRSAEAALAPAAAAAPAAPDAAPTPAGEVQLRGTGLRGRIVAEADGMVTVQAGRLTVRVARRDVLPAGPAATSAPGSALAADRPAREDAPRECHLLGLTVEEAQPVVEKFLDDALLAGHREVRLVHGKGTGALRRAVEQWLRAHPMVSAFRLAEPAAGGSGATVATLETEADTPALVRPARPAGSRRAAR